MSAIEVPSPPPAAIVRLFNPAVMALMRTPLGAAMRRSVLVLRFTGRKSGRRYDIPVTAHRWDEGLMVLTAAPWRVNFRGGRDVDVTFEGRTTPMRGVLVEHPRTVAETYAQRISELGLAQARKKLNLKITVDREPTVGELAEAVEREKLSIVWLKDRG